LASVAQLLEKPFSAAVGIIAMGFLAAALITSVYTIED
jgi:hypothetical protein